MALITWPTNFDFSLQNSWRSWRNSEFEWQIVTSTYTTTREFKPVTKNASTPVKRIIRQQSVKSILLFASATLSAIHLFVLVAAIEQKNLITQICWFESKNIFISKILTCIFPNGHTVQRDDGSPGPKVLLAYYLPKKERQLHLSQDKHFWKLQLIFQYDLL